jgi:GT2 family glycosyltransferase
MNKICVVIPTIYDQPLRYHLWDRLGEADLVETVFIVDNGKNCGTPERKKRKWHKNVYSQQEQNLHWAKSCNLGIEYALQNGFNFVCLLNDDVKLQAGFFEGMLAAWHSVESPGLIVPLYNSVFHTEAQDFSQREEFKPKTQETEVLYTDGTCMLIHRNSVENAGMLENSFGDPNWGVDIDYGYRLRQAGLKLYVTHRAKLYHGRRMYGKSAGGNSAIKYYGSKEAWHLKGNQQMHSDLSRKYGRNWKEVLGLCNKPYYQ